MGRTMRARGSETFTKPPLSHERMLEQLESRGLVVPDRDRALRYLRHLGYYRLSPYTIPFQAERSTHTFAPGAEFDDVLDLYVFDRKLRLHCLDALERVEVAVRAALTDHMSTTYDDAHWYIDAAHFRDRQRHADLLDIVRRLVRSRLLGLAESGHDRIHHPSALEHYLMTYRKPELPPSWLMVESLTIGQLAGLYRNLARRSDRVAVAASVGSTDTVLTSWLQVYVRVRNICAHHGRLWNVGLGVTPMIPKSPAISWLSGAEAVPEASRQRLYPVLVSLQSLLDTVSPRSRWADRLYELLHDRPEMNLHGMGVPVGWSSDPFWSRHLR